MFKQKKTALYMRFATSQQVRQKTIRNRLRALAMLSLKSSYHEYRKLHPAFRQTYSRRDT